MSQKKSRIKFVTGFSVQTGKKKIGALGGLWLISNRQAGDRIAKRYGKSTRNSLAGN